MAIDLPIYNERRVTMLRWERARHGDPHRKYPEVDDRGTRTPEFASVVGLTEGDEVLVRVQRVLIDNAVDLYAVSSDATKVDVIAPVDGKLAAAQDTDLTIKGLAGGNPNEAKIEVHFGSKTGPIVGVLVARCYTLRRVRITPHLVTIADPGGVGGIPSTANVNDIMRHVRAIWRPCGIDFTVNPTSNDAVNFGTAGIVSDNPFPGELVNLLATNWVANTINVYFVHQIGTATTLGYGFSRPSSVAFGTGNPGIILGDQRPPGVVHDTPWAGNDLAHEAGHFLQLWHPNNQQPPNEREDTWSRRMLMHANNRLPVMGNWKDDNVGYGKLGGRPRRGALVTHKHILHFATDNETSTARSAILAGPY